MANLVTPTFIEEDPILPVPKPSGRPPKDNWNELLAPIRANPSHTYRIFVYEKKYQANNRAASILESLWIEDPTLDYKLVVGELPQEGDYSQWGVYACFLGELADEEVAARTQLRVQKAEEARQRKEAREAAKVAAEPDIAPTTDPDGFPLTAAQRVKAAAAK